MFLTLLRNIIVACQHSFMPGRCTVTNLTCFKNATVHIESKRSQLDVIYFDLSKISNLVDHSLLLNQVEGGGARG